MSFDREVESLIMRYTKSRNKCRYWQICDLYLKKIKDNNDNLGFTRTLCKKYRFY